MRSSTMFSYSISTKSRFASSTVQAETFYKFKLFSCYTTYVKKKKKKDEEGKQLYTFFKHTNTHPGKKVMIVKSPQNVQDFNTSSVQDFKCSSRCCFPTKILVLFIYITFLVGYSISPYPSLSHRLHFWSHCLLLLM